MLQLAHMIAYLEGKILQKTPNYLILENSGVGYKIFATPEILEMPIGTETKLYIYHKSGDDGQTLFGMPDFAGLQFFEMLVQPRRLLEPSLDQPL